MFGWMDDTSLPQTHTPCTAIHTYFLPLHTLMAEIVAALVASVPVLPSIDHVAPVLRTALVTSG